jgi:hypothetical protein
VSDNATGIGAFGSVFVDAVVELDVVVTLVVMPALALPLGAELVLVVAAELAGSSSLSPAAASGTGAEALPSAPAAACAEAGSTHARAHASSVRERRTTRA